MLREVEDMIHKEKWKGLGWFSLDKVKRFNCCLAVLKGDRAIEGMEPDPLEVDKKRTGRNSHKPQHKNLGARQELHEEHWSGLHRECAVSSSLEMCEACLDRVWNSTMYLQS